MSGPAVAAPLLEGHLICHASELFICRDLWSKTKHVGFALSGASGVMSFPRRSQSSLLPFSALVLSYQ